MAISSVSALQRLIGLDQVIESSTPIHVLILDTASFDKSHKELCGSFGTEIVKNAQKDKDDSHSTTVARVVRASLQHVTLHTCSRSALFFKFAWEIPREIQVINMSLNPLVCIDGFNCRSNLHSLCKHTDSLFKVIHSLDSEDYHRQLKDMEFCHQYHSKAPPKNPLSHRHQKLCPYTLLLSHYAFYDRLTKGNRAFIVALGNEAQLVSKNLQYWIKFHPIISNVELRSRTIFAINIQANGSDLSACSNTPGTLGRLSICAPGAVFGKKGTSFAAPWISGVIALVRKAFSQLTAHEACRAVKRGALPLIIKKGQTILLKSRKHVPRYSKDVIRASFSKYGWGLLDAKGALDEAAQLVKLRSPKEIVLEYLDDVDLDYADELCLSELLDRYLPVVDPESLQKPSFRQKRKKGWKAVDEGSFSSKLCKTTK